MKVICVESSFLIEDEKVQTAVKGSIYTVIDAVKDPKPVITKEGGIRTFAQGWWFRFEETGDLWHHQFRFKKVEETVQEKIPTSIGPKPGAVRILLPKKELIKPKSEESVKKIPTKVKNVGKMSKLK
jgi:hypothetical protein